MMLEAIPALAGWPFTYSQLRLEAGCSLFPYPVWVRCVLTHLHSVLLPPGLPIAELPHSLVQSLAFLLDPSLNGAKNFSHVALELGLMPQLLGRISGFEQLVAHFTYAGAAVTVPLLAQALQRLQRFDALLLLCDHFTLSPAPDRQR